MPMVAAMAALSCFRCLARPSAPRAIVEHNFLTMVAVDSRRRLQLKGVHSCGSQSLYLRICRQQIVNGATPPPSLFLRGGIRASVSELESSEEVSPCSAFFVAHERSVVANDITGLFEGHRRSRLWSVRQSFRSESSSARGERLLHAAGIFVGIIGAAQRRVRLPVVRILLLVVVRGWVVVVVRTLIVVVVEISERLHAGIDQIRAECREGAPWIESETRKIQRESEQIVEEPQAITTAAPSPTAASPAIAVVTVAIAAVTVVTIATVSKTGVTVMSIAASVVIEPVSREHRAALAESALSERTRTRKARSAETAHRRVRTHEVRIRQRTLPLRLAARKMRSANI